MHANKKVNLDALSLNSKCCHSCKKLKICYLFIAILALLFQSCELEPNMPENVIKPQVLNNNGFYFREHPYFIYTSIGQYPVGKPDILGFSRFENIPLPYDFETLINKYFDPETVCIYHNLNKRNPKIVLPFPQDTNVYHRSNYNECFLIVYFPPIPEGKTGKVKFISKDLFIQEDEIINAGESFSKIKLKIPFDRNSINGKLIFLQGEIQHNYWETNWTSIDNFGMKYISVPANSIDTVIFTQHDIQYNPPESHIDFSATFPLNYTYYTTLSAAISFPGYNINSDLILFKTIYPEQGVSYVRNVPAEIGIPFSIRIKCTFRPSFRTYLTENLKTAIIQPENSANLVFNQIQLRSPLYNATNITKDSCFKIYDDNEKGIYLFYFLIPNYPPVSQGVVIATDKNTLRLSDINSRNFNLESNERYYWGVQKIYGFSSIDEFTEIPFIFNGKFQSATSSDVWMFRAAP